jgi:hypothetical protein
MRQAGAVKSVLPVSVMGLCTGGRQFETVEVEVKCV